MRRIGEVIEVNDDMALVRVKRESSCGENCANCRGCTSTTSTVNAINTACAAVGDMVFLEMGNGAFISLAMLGYVAPIVSTLISYIAVRRVTDSTAVADAVALIVLCLTFLIFYFLDKHISRARTFRSEITRIIGQGNSNGRE